MSSPSWHQGHEGVAAMGAAFGRVWSRSVTSPRILGCGESVVQVTTQTWTAHATGRVATVDVVELFSYGGSGRGLAAGTR
jgi:uncharacterized protein